jgi:hypothetical protein
LRRLPSGRIADSGVPESMPNSMVGHALFEARDLAKDDPDNNLYD